MIVCINSLPSASVDCKNIKPFNGYKSSFFKKDLKYFIHGSRLQKDIDIHINLYLIVMNLSRSILGKLLTY
jgi:hypothetical protein